MLTKYCSVLLIKEKSYLQNSSPNQSIAGRKQEHGLKSLPWVNTNWVFGELGSGIQ